MGHTLDRFDAALTISLCVEHHPLEVGPLPERGYVDEILERVDSLALLAYKQPRIIGGDVHGDKAPGVVDLHMGFEAHGFENRGNELPYFDEKVLGGLDLLVLRRITVDFGKRRSTCIYGIFGRFLLGNVRHGGIGWGGLQDSSGVKFPIVRHFFFFLRFRLAILAARSAISSWLAPDVCSLPFFCA